MVTLTKRSSDRRSDALHLVEEPATTNNISRFVNRELSWIQFNSRVLSLAADPSLPLLERVRFLSIFTSNLDEFFMKRVGGLNRQIAAGVTTLSPDGYTPRQQIASIKAALLPLLAEQQRLFIREIRPALRKEGIEFLEWSELQPQERAFASEYFQSKVFPMLTPLSVDAGHPFPFLSNLSLSLGFTLIHPSHASDTLFARVKISGNLLPWIELPTSTSGNATHRFLSLQELVVQHAQHLFPNMTITSSMPFRITRNIDLVVDDEDAEDLMEAIEEGLRQRRVGEVVRLEHGVNPDPWILNFLTAELELDNEDIFEVKGLLDFTELNAIADLDIPRLRFSRWVPTVPPSVADEGSMFSLIRSRDLMVHHPYESFAATVEHFVREAANDPKVMAIKMTLYRVGQVTPLINSLIRAAEEGKQVVCLVELKARFDEKQNIHWAQRLEEAGVHVVYGIPGLKIHSKTMIVVRQDPDGVRAYAHCGTGNYHSRTANLYTDLGIFTAKPEFTRDMLHYFNYLTGRSMKEDYEKILVAPLTMEKTFISLIQREAKNEQEGAPSGIIGKMNALEDLDIIEALYGASNAGVPIDLIVRGACALRPQVPGMSEQIHVRSVVGRLLEHSRIYYFRNASVDPIDGIFYIGSADWMGRNMHRRVEVCIPIEERAHRERLWQILGVMLDDRRQAWEMLSSGFYTRLQSGPEGSGTHETLMALAANTANPKR